MIICLEGVLCKDEPPNGVPVWVGLQLYHCLRSQFRLVIDSSHGDITDIEHWLSVNGLKSHSLILWRAAVHDQLSEINLRMAHLGEWRGQGFDITLYVTAEPAVATRMLKAGVPTLLLTHPAYARPEHRPDDERGLKPWADIEEEVTEAALHRDHRVRIDAEMEP